MRRHYSVLATHSAYNLLGPTLIVRYLLLKVPEILSLKLNFLYVHNVFGLNNLLPAWPKKRVLPNFPLLYLPVGMKGEYVLSVSIIEYNTLISN